LDKRIESLAPNGKNSILIGESVYKRAEPWVMTEALPAMLLKGKKREVKVFELLGLR